jgi:hypothetical protein
MINTIVGVNNKILPNNSYIVPITELYLKIKTV